MRIAEVVYHTAQPEEGTETEDKYLANILDELAGGTATTSGTDALKGKTQKITAEERRTLDKVGEALARLGRVKRVGLTVRDKMDFIEAFSKS